MDDAPRENPDRTLTPRELVGVEIREVPVQQEACSAHRGQRVDLRLRARVVSDIYFLLRILLKVIVDIIVSVVIAAPAKIDGHVFRRTLFCPAMCYNFMANFISILVVALN